MHSISRFDYTTYIKMPFLIHAFDDWRQCCYLMLINITILPSVSSFRGSVMLVQLWLFLMSIVDILIALSGHAVANKLSQPAMFVCMLLVVASSSSSSHHIFGVILHA